MEPRDAVASHAEQVLRESLRAIIEAWPLALITLDPTNRITTWNKAAQRIFGWSEDEVLGQLPPYIPADKQEEFRVLRARETAGGVIAGIDLRRQRKDGSPVDISLWTAPIRDAVGRVIGSLGLLEDITERKQADEALIRRTRQLEAVGLVTAEITRELDLGALLGLILRRVMELVGAGGGSLYLWDQATERLVPRVWHGMPDSVGGLPLRLGEGLCGTVAERAAGLIVNDYRTFPRAHPRFLAETTIAACVAEPLGYRGRLVGVIAVNRQDRERSFTEEDQRLLCLFAAQAGIAIENARLYETTMVRARQLATLNALTRTLTMKLDRQAVAQRILSAVQVLVPGAAAHLLEQAEGEELLRMVASVGLRRPESGPPFRLHAGDGLAGIATATRRPVASADIARDPSFVNRPWAASENLVSGIVVPLVYAEQVIGVLSVFLRNFHTFTEDEIEMLQAFGTHGAIALENARLFEQLRAGHERLLDLTQRLVSAQEEERHRLSRELHDETSQSLTALRITLDLIRQDLGPEADALRQRLGDAVVLAESITDQLRRLAQGLRPPALDALGLDVTLEAVCRDFGRRTHIAVEYEGKDLPPLPDAIAIHLYRFLQEALANVSKHACAQRVRVVLEYDGDLISLLAEDDGAGFHVVPAAATPRTGIGLVGMRERLELLRGSLEIASSPGQGTRLVARVPWRDTR